MLIDNLIKKIDILCLQNHVSINQMLKDCNLSKSVIDNLKKGSIPSVDKIKKISEYFDVSTDYLLGTEQKESSSLQLSDKEQELFNDIKSLSPEQQLAIRAVIDSYKNK